MKGLINLKNKDHKCFMWYHVRLINPTNSHRETINKQDKKIAANLNYSDIAFLLDISGKFMKDFNRLMFSKTKHKDKNHFCMSCFQNFSTKEVLSNHRTRCLLINGCQGGNYESEIIKFTNIINKYPFFLKYMLTQNAF